MRKVNERREDFKRAKSEVYSKYPSLTEKHKLIVSLDVPELHCQLQEGSLTAQEVFEAFTAKAVEVDRGTNAVVEFLLQEGLELAKKLDRSEERGPLHGIPVSIKEHVALEGKDATVGIAGNLGKLSSREAELVRALKHLGAVPFCRTNLAQTCYSFDCSNPIYGTTLNFHDPARSRGFETHGGEIEGLVGVANTLGFMGRSARGIEFFAKLFLNGASDVRISDPRFVPIPWREKVWDGSA